ncbi:MAG: rod shape-determining protein MreD [Paracoccaceae bacterium]|jgi:rod shape-determining protein MreD
MIARPDHGRRASGPGATEDSVIIGFGRLVTLALIVAAVFAALLGQMAPLGLAPRSWPAPDLMFCVLAYGAMARPDALPIPATFALALVGDLITGGPVGAGALALFLTLETLKRREALTDVPSRLRDLAAAALGAAAVLIGPWLMMRLSFADGPPLADLAPRWAATMIAFVPVAAAMRYGLRIRRRALRTDGPLWGDR